MREREREREREGMHTEITEKNKTEKPTEREVESEQSLWFHTSNAYITHLFYQNYLNIQQN